MANGITAWPSITPLIFLSEENHLMVGMLSVFGVSDPIVTDRRFPHRDCDACESNCVDAVESLVIATPSALKWRRVFSALVPSGFGNTLEHFIKYKKLSAIY